MVASRQPPAAATSLTGYPFRSVTHFLRIGCHSPPGSGSIPAFLYARLNQSSNRCRLHGVVESFGPGKTGVFPMVRLAFRCVSKALRTASLIGTTCSYPFLSFSARQRIVSFLKSMSSQRRFRQAEILRPVPSATTSASLRSGSTRSATSSSFKYSSCRITGRLGVRFSRQSTTSMSQKSGTDARIPSKNRQSVVFPMSPEPNGVGQSSLKRPSKLACVRDVDLARRR